MLTLTVLQPWASLLVCGVKTVENRTWASAGLRPGAWLAIHAGRLDAHAISPAFVEDILARWPGGPSSFSSLPRCTIVGAVRFEGYGHGGRRKGYPGECLCRFLPDGDAICDLRPSCNPWASGPVCWCMDRAVALESPKPSWSQRGRLGLWPCPADVKAGLDRLIAERHNDFQLRLPHTISGRITRPSTTVGANP